MRGAFGSTTFNDVKKRDIYIVKAHAYKHSTGPKSFGCAVRKPTPKKRGHFYSGPSPLYGPVMAQCKAQNLPTYDYGRGKGATVVPWHVVAQALVHMDLLVNGAARNVDLEQVRFSLAGHADGTPLDDVSGTSYQHATPSSAAKDSCYAHAVLRVTYTVPVQNGEAEKEEAPGRSEEDVFEEFVAEGASKLRASRSRRHTRRT